MFNIYPLVAESSCSKFISESFGNIWFAQLSKNSGPNKLDGKNESTKLLNTAVPSGKQLAPNEVVWICYVQVIVFLRHPSTDYLTSDDILNHILWYITDYKLHEIDFPSWSSDIQWQYNQIPSEIATKKDQTTNNGYFQI